ncbi:MAG: DNA replication/repair protein RecF [Desulfuromonadales bacterium]|nr:DNA replication/repair protein RecF [Desulfuromonadales bacterium]
MQIDKLYFEHFRNLKTQHIDPKAGINIIWGENGQGKTNLLEGIYLFAHLKSFRGAGNIDLIQAQGDHARISASVKRSQVSRQLELKILPTGRSFLLDGKKPRPVESLLEALRAILFTPDELYPLRTLPAARRSLIDRGIFQRDPAYLARAIQYERVLKQRNRLLRERAGADEILPWTRKLIESGAQIRQARQVFIAELQPYLRFGHELLSGEQEVVELLYPSAADSLAQHQELLAAELQGGAARESRLGLTCAGPHRDDPVFTMNGAAVRHVASQGQWRTLILSFKIALMSLLQERIGAWPVLLFDDMSAELDTARQERLFSLLTDSKAQVFVTTTDLQPFLRFGRATIHPLHMVAGEIQPG